MGADHTAGAGRTGDCLPGMSGMRPEEAGKSLSGRGAPGQPLLGYEEDGGVDGVGPGCPRLHLAAKWKSVLPTVEHIRVSTRGSPVEALAGLRITACLLRSVCSETVVTGSTPSVIWNYSRFKNCPWGWGSGCRSVLGCLLSLQEALSCGYRSQCAGEPSREEADAMGVKGGLALPSA